MSVKQAIDSALAALRWLQANSAQQTFFKYCSTFDSTSQGNIGPVADALLKNLESDFTLVCPAFPTNGRSIYRGYLFVGDILLSDSSMKDHPLTPMRDSSLVRLMSEQSERTVGLIDINTVRQGPLAIQRQIEKLKTEHVSYGVIDAITDADLKTIGQVAADHELVTGGSAVAMGLPDNFRKKGILTAPITARLLFVGGRSVVLAGSCSQATRRQIAYVRKHWPARKINVDAVVAGEDVAANLIGWASNQSAHTPVLIFAASSDPDEMAEIQRRYGVDEAGALVEKVMGQIVVGLANNGFSRIIVAGGETSGAVVSSLQVKALRIGPEIDPDVPWTESLGERHLALALKSGNFGGEDFFTKAFEVLK